MLTLEPIDMAGFNRFKDGIVMALIGTGQDGDLHKVARSETKELAWEIARQLAPGKASELEAKGTAKIEKDVKREFAPGPRVAFEQSKRKPQFGETDITWLYAGPAFLVGVWDSDLQPAMSMDAMAKTLSSARSAGYPRGQAWVQLGQRGKQHVQLHNRTIVSRDRFQALVRRQAARLGRQAATFAFTAWKLGKKSMPDFLKRHFDALASDGAAIFRPLGGDADYAIEFGSRTPGIVSNPHTRRKIKNAVENRRHKMVAKTKKLLAGYVYDWNTGRIFQRNRGEEMLKQLEANEEMFDSF
jgi:hypothetical protein